MTERAVRRAPSFADASLRIFGMSLGEMLWSRRTLYMVIVVGAPVVLAIVGRVISVAGMSSLRVNGARVGGTSIFGTMIWLLFVRFIVPVLGAFYGTGIIADEVDDRTITYLFARPIPRGAVVAGKYLAYLACTGLVVLPAVVLVYFTLVPPVDIATTVQLLVKDLGALALGLAAYGALFAFTGAVLKRPLVFGLVFAFGWEQLAMLLPGYLRRATITYYVQGLVPQAPPVEGTSALLQSVFHDVPSATSAALWLFFAVVIFLTLAIRAVSRREYVLEQ